MNSLRIVLKWVLNNASFTWAINYDNDICDTNTLCGQIQINPRRSKWAQSCTCWDFLPSWIYSSWASSTVLALAACTGTPETMISEKIGWEGDPVPADCQAKQDQFKESLTTPCSSFQASAEWVSCLPTPAILAEMPPQSMIPNWEAKSLKGTRLLLCWPLSNKLALLIPI